MTALTVHGADLSHHNPTPDLKKAKAAGLQWLIHKATEGSTYTDPTYDMRRNLAKAAGLPFGAYGFARPDAGGKDAKLEALHLFKVAKPVAGDIVPALDFEVNYAGAEAWCKEWMAELGRLLKLKGLAVPGRGLHYGPNDFGSDYPHYRWVPRYNNDNRPPSVPWDIFQFSDGVLGNPKSFPGLGNVDLNTMRPGFKLDPLILRPIKVPVVESEELFVMHTSLQYSDTPAQMDADTEKIFAYAERKKAAWVTGTEAGEDTLWSRVQAAGRRHGYRLKRARGNWIAVRQEIIKKGTWESGEDFVEKNDNVVGHGHDSVFPWVTFEHKTPGIGVISIAAVHYPRFGQKAGDPNFWVNRKYAEHLGAWALKKGAGSALVFVAGDFNMPDHKAQDLFFDQPLTTFGDELQKWPNTGHGPIDAMATYDKDVRVTVTGYQALDDKRFFLNADHFAIQGTVSVRKYVLAA